MSIRNIPRKATSGQEEVYIPLDSNNSNSCMRENNSRGLSDFHSSLIHCKVCRRSFRSDRIEKHEKACVNASKKRPAFNMKKQQFPHLEQEILKMPTSLRRKAITKKYANSKWHREHLDLINNLRNGRSTEIPEENDENISDTCLEGHAKCPHCQQMFGPSSAEKHIESCRQIIHKPNPLKSMSRLPKIKSKRSDFILHHNSHKYHPKKKNTWLTDDRGQSKLFSSFKKTFVGIDRDSPRSTQASVSKFRRDYCLMSSEQCKKCKATLPEKARFCMICGFKL